jgi:phosphoribosylglycinamide formyltransferase-1
MSLKKIAVLVSGGGTNLQSLIDRVHGQAGEIALVVSDSPDAYALQRAQNAGIPHCVIDYASFANKADFFAQLKQTLLELNPAVIVLAGFMKILPQDFYEAFPNRMINIHPALIPSFCGKGYYGLNVHRAALDYGVKVTGATVHFADGGADTGPIILQKAVEIEPNDTPEILQKRVMTAEHELLPKAVTLFLNDQLQIDGRTVQIKETK